MFGFADLSLWHFRMKCGLKASGWCECICRHMWHYVRKKREIGKKGTGHANGSTNDEHQMKWKWEKRIMMMVCVWNDGNGILNEKEKREKRRLTHCVWLHCELFELLLHPHFTLFSSVPRTKTINSSQTRGKWSTITDNVWFVGLSLLLSTECQKPASACIFT